ncbi:MAG: hypothetical protein Q4E73_11420, partial [Lachnospiraceae bacterium]|nr:hypothetical protein [Lachnospiraceae bacterium]
CTWGVEIWTTEKFWEEMYGGYNVLCVVAWNKLYKRELFEGVRYKKGIIFEDEYIIDLLVEKCKSIVLIKEVLYMYRSHQNSIMANLTLNSKIDKIEVLMERADRLWKKKNQKFAEKTLARDMARMSSVLAQLALNSGKNTEEVLRFNELKGRMDSLIMQVCRESISWRFRLSCILFLKNIRLYGVVTKCYMCVKRILKI